MNGQVNKYFAYVYYDFFDKGIVSFINGILMRQGIDSKLLAATDGMHEYVFFYNNEEWAENFQECFQVQLIN